MIISIFSNKGGVGKTAATTNIAYALGRMGKKVLVIDNDSQCNCSSSLLPTGTSDVFPNSLLQLYEGETNVSKLIYPSKFDNVDILKNSPLTAAKELFLYQNIAQSARLFVDHVRPWAEENYDYTIIDNPPSLGITLIMSLSASSCAICPVDLGSTFALDGLNTSIKMIDDVAQTANPDLVFLRVLINKADLRTSIAKTLSDFIHRTFGADKIFETSIPFATVIQQAELARTSVIKHAPASTAAKRFKELAEEIIRLTTQMSLPSVGVK